MLEIKLNKNNYFLPEKWEELTQKQFIYLVGLMLQANAGELYPMALRALFVCNVLGLKDKHVHRLSKKDRFNENIYRIASEMRFMFKYDYLNKKSFNKIPEETRKALLRIDPEELGESVHVKAARKLKRCIQSDAVFAKQMVPVIKKRRHSLTAYHFESSEGILTSSLTAEQFSDALTIYQQFVTCKEPDENLLNKLVAILYTNPYSSQQAIELSKNLNWVHPAIKQAVVYNFMAIQTYLFDRTKYKVLFNVSNNASKKSKNISKNSLGFSNTIYSMVRKGYGDLDSMSDQNIVKFLEAMYSDLVSTLRSLKQQDMEITDISEKTGLTIATINSLV